MGIIEIRSTVTHQSLMRKSKSDLAYEVLSWMDFCHRKELTRKEYENNLRDLALAVSRGRKGCVGDHHIYTSQIDTKYVDELLKKLGRE